MALSDELGHCIAALQDEGFDLPLYFTCMSVNGTMLYGAYVRRAGEEEVQCDILAAHGTEDDLALPLNIVFLDYQGRAARMVFGPDGSSEEIQVFTEQ